ncbi:MAG: protease modulator HflC [Clostridiales bacterium]|jgi:membrane protease subunit HflC|nr:protease modulator HflC [Clostridiales bacterium]
MAKKTNKTIMVMINGLIVVAVLIIVLATTVLYVQEDEYVCVKRFGEVVAIHDKAGLYFKIPFIEDTTTIPRNLMVYNLQPSEALTLDKKSMIVSSCAVWKITDPRKFLQTAVRISEAESRLDANVYNSVKNLLSTLEQAEAINARGGGDNDLDGIITENVATAMSDYGISVVDVQIKQFDLPPDNKDAVYQRMISERGQIAAQYIAEGQSEAEIIRNSADKEKVLVISQAQAQAAQIKAEGESEYMRILADAYSGEDRAEFYEFIRAMDALKVAMNGDKTLILPIESPLTKWFVTK